jgi:Tol biopolymer transport system component
MLCALILLQLTSEPPYALAKPGLEPTVFAEGSISTTEFESHPHFTGDGKTLYFVKSTPQFSDWKIYVSTFASGVWTKAELAPFSGKYRDADPFITADGKRFFFISDRPGQGKAAGDMDIWYMDASKGGWGEPHRLGPEVNSDGDEWFPATTADGTLYFGSPRAGTKGGCDLWCSKPVNGGYGVAVNLGDTINTSSDEIEPFISRDGSMLIFNSDRPGGLGGLDFYVSTTLNGSWSAPKPLSSSINSKATELSPKLTPNGKYFLFTKLRKGRLGDIMIVDAKAIISH